MLEPPCAGVAELVDARDLKSLGAKAPCRFDSGRPHHLFNSICELRKRAIQKMAEKSAIEWTDATWNPVAGCSIITAGCTNCYAMQMAKRLEAMGVEKYEGLTLRSGKRTVWNGVVREDRAALDIPYGWKKPKNTTAARKT